MWKFHRSSRSMVRQAYHDRLDLPRVLSWSTDAARSNRQDFRAGGFYRESAFLASSRAKKTSAKTRGDRRFQLSFLDTSSLAVAGCGN